MDNVIIKFTAESDLDKANEDLLRLKDRENDIKNAMRQLQVDYQKQNFAIQGEVKGRENQIKALDKLRQKIVQQQKAYEDELKSAKKNTADLATEMSKLDKTVTNGAINKTFRTRMREVREEMSQMKLEGRDTGAEYERLKNTLGQLQDTMDDVAKEGKKVGSDTRVFDTMYESAQLAAGAFSVGQGAMALFGAEGEQVEAAMVKLQSAIAITTGLQSVGNALQKESNVMMAIGSAQKKLLALSENLDTAAKSKNIIVTKAATTTQWLLNKAAMANPYVLLAMAVLTVVGALAIFAMNADNASEKQVELNKYQAIALEQNERYANSLKSKSDELTKNLENELALMKAKGASNNDLAKKEQEIANQKVKNAASYAGFYAEEIQNINRNKVELEKYKKALDNLTLSGDEEIVINGVELDKDAIQGKIDNIAKNLEIGITAKTDYTQAKSDAEAFRLQQIEKSKIAAYKESVSVAELRLLTSKKYSIEELKADEQLIIAKRNQELSNVNLTASERKRLIIQADKDIYDARYEYSLFQLQRQKDLIDAEIELSIQGSEDEFKLRKVSLELQSAAELSQKNLTVEQKLLIENKYLAALKKLNDDYNMKVLQSSINTDNSYLNTRLINARKGSEEELTIKIDMLENQKALDIANAENTLAKGKELDAKLREIDAKYLSDKNNLTAEQIDAEYQMRSQAVNDERFFLEKTSLIKDSILGTDYKKSQAYKNLELEDITNTQSELADLKSQGLEGTETYLEKERDLKEKQNQWEIEAEQEKAEIIAGIKQVLTQVATSIMDGYWDNYNAKLDEEKYKLDTFYTSDIEAARGNANLKYMSEAELSKKKLAIKRKEAQAEKDKAIFEAVIAGILGVVKALPNYVLAAVVAVTAAASVAAISTKPLPTYWKGRKSKPTNGGEYAMVGEHGPELMYVPGGAGILPAHHSRNVADAINSMAGYGMPIPMSEKGGGFYIDYNKLGMAVANNVRIPEQKSVSVIVDRHGIQTIEQGRKSNVLNQKYYYHGS